MPGDGAKAATAATAARADGRQVRWDRHNQVRRQHIIDAAIEVLGETEPGGELHVQQIARPRRAEPHGRLPALHRPR